MASRVGGCMPSDRPLGYHQDSVVMSTDGHSGQVLLPKGPTFHTSMPAPEGQVSVP